MTFPYEATVQSMRDIGSQAPDAICELTPVPVAFNLLVNRDAPPFDNPDIRRAMQLTIDRKSFVDILLEGQGDIGGAMQTPPGGSGVCRGDTRNIAGYGPDVAKSRAEARKLMEKHGYRPDHRLPVKVATRNIAQYRDPAVILIDQLKEIYIDGELDAVETVTGFPRSLARTSWLAPIYRVGVDDPDAISTSIMPAVRSAITPTTATPSSRRCTSSSRSSPTRQSARNWSGRSTAG